MLNEIDTVAILIDHPAAGLSRGETGTIVNIQGADAFLVEFVAKDGWTYAMEVFHRDELLKLLPHREVAEPQDRPVEKTSGGSSASGLTRFWPFKR